MRFFNYSLLISRNKNSLSIQIIVTNNSNQIKVEIFIFCFFTLLYNFGANSIKELTKKPSVILVNIHLKNEYLWNFTQ